MRVRCTYLEHGETVRSAYMPSNPCCPHLDLDFQRNGVWLLTSETCYGLLGVLSMRQARVMYLFDQQLSLTNHQHVFTVILATY